MERARARAIEITILDQKSRECLTKNVTFAEILK